MTTSTIDIGKMRAAAVEASGLLKVLANPERLLLLCELSQGERCVSELEEELGILQPTLSQQLSVLRAERLVETRRQGRRIYYAIREAKVLGLLQTLYRLFCAPGGRPGR